MSYTAVVFGRLGLAGSETQFAPGPDARGHYTFRVSGVSPDGAAISTASFPLGRAIELADAMWESSSSKPKPEQADRDERCEWLRARDGRAEWRRMRIAAHARMAEALVELYRPSRDPKGNAVENARFWLWVLELGTQTPVEVLARARYAFEIRVEPIISVRVEANAGAITVAVGPRSARAPCASLDAVLAAAAGMLETTGPELCATYALRRIVNDSGDEGLVSGCADSRDILRGNRRRTIKLHKHAVCSTCGKVMCNSAEKTAVPPRMFYPRLVVCNLCPFGRDFRLWDGTRLVYESHTAALREADEAKQSNGGVAAVAAVAAVSAASAMSEVMIAVMLSIFRVAATPAAATLTPLTPLAAHLCRVPTKMVRIGFDGLLSPFYRAEDLTDRTGRTETSKQRKAPAERAEPAEPAAKAARTGTESPTWPVA